MELYFGKFNFVVAREFLARSSEDNRDICEDEKDNEKLFITFFLSGFGRFFRFDFAHGKYYSRKREKLKERVLG